MTKLKDTKRLSINVTITGDFEIKKLNKKYLNRDFPTDVLSFEIGEELEDGTFYLGDIIVNKDRAEKQCKEYDNDLEHEVAQLVEHGVLHLLGVHHKHDDEEEVHGVKTK